MAGVGPGFRIAAAYDYAEQHGLSAEAKDIRNRVMHATITKGSAVRKGYFIRLFEKNGVMQDFAARHWPTRETDGGSRRYKRLLQWAELNDKRIRGDLTGEPPDEDDSDLEGIARPEKSDLFALEAHLRDFIAGNLGRVPIGSKKLSLFKTPDGKSGVEYRTGVGPIDILAVDTDGNFFVFELKLERGPDRALGQLARYMGWVGVHLAGSKTVTGVIVANSIDEKLRYAAAVVPGVLLLEYELAFSIRGVTAISAGMNA